MSSLEDFRLQGLYDEGTGLSTKPSLSRTEGFKAASSADRGSTKTEGKRLGLELNLKSLLNIVSRNGLFSHGTCWIVFLVALDLCEFHLILVQFVEDIQVQSNIIVHSEHSGGAFVYSNECWKWEISYSITYVTFFQEIFNNHNFFQ